MTLTAKALWVIERNLDRPLTLGEIAAACGVSPHHLAHAFGRTAGQAVMQYVRRRRLAAAARALAAGAPDILDLALSHGYGSHEAFTRAFRAEFGATPGEVRHKGNTEDLPMNEAMKIPPARDAEPAPPRIERAGPMLFVGLAGRHALGATQGVPAQWQAFMARYGEIADKADPIPVGVSRDMDEDGNFDYLCAVAVKRFSGTPRGLVELRIPARGYAVFTHRDHVSTIGATYGAIFERWRPETHRLAADAPMLERHLPGFDPMTGLGGVEIWIPIDDAG
jgi:AraC family transcriptional regulator